MAIIYSKEQLSEARDRKTDKYKNSWHGGAGWAGRIKNPYGYVKNNLLFSPGSRKSTFAIEGRADLRVESKLTATADVIRAGKTAKYPFSKQGDQIKLITIDSEAVYQQYAAELDLCFTGFESEYEGGYALMGVRDYYNFAGTRIVEIDGKIVGVIRPQLGRWNTLSDGLSGKELLEIALLDDVDKHKAAAAFNNALIYNADIIPYVSEIYVKPEYRGYGVATRLYQLAQANGVKMLMIDLKKYLQKPDYFAKLYPFVTVSSLAQPANDKMLLLLSTEDFIHLNNCFVPNTVSALKQLLNKWFNKQAVTTRHKYLEKETFEMHQELEHNRLMSKKEQPTNAEINLHQYYVLTDQNRDSRVHYSQPYAELCHKWFRKLDTSSDILIKMLKDSTPTKKMADYDSIDSATQAVVDVLKQHKPTIRQKYQNKITQLA
jgi:GNAT superfamily N-acetyltransferase